MNKLNEILKPKLTKEEAIILLRLICKRFAEIFEANEHYCVGNDCETCYYYDVCLFVNKVSEGMWDVVDNISKALSVDIWLDWDAEFIIIKISGVMPDAEDDDWVFSYILQCLVPANASCLKNISEENYEFEPETIADIRSDWRFFNDRLGILRLERDLPAFFELEEVDSDDSNS